MASGLKSRGRSHEIVFEPWLKSSLSDSLAKKFVAVTVAHSKFPPVIVTRVQDF